MFSIPLFDWDAPEMRLMFRRSFWTPRLMVYLALTVPLTVLTFALWGSWVYFQHVKNRKRRDDARGQLDRGTRTPEKKEIEIIALKANQY